MTTAGDPAKLRYRSPKLPTNVILPTKVTLRHFSLRRSVFLQAHGDESISVRGVPAWGRKCPLYPRKQTSGRKKKYPLRANSLYGDFLRRVFLLIRIPLLSSRLTIE